MAAKLQRPKKLSVATIMAIAALMGGVAVADDMGPQLKGREIKAAFVDAQVHGVSPDGAKWSAIYKADGTAEYNGGKTGKWRISGDQFCNRVSGYDEACVAVFKLGDHRYQFMRADGKKGSIVSVE
jgi:hypothetical protein